MFARRRPSLLLHATLLLLAGLTLYPMIFMMLNAARNGTQTGANPFGLPWHPLVENFVRLEKIQRLGMRWIRMNVPFPWDGEVGSLRTDYVRFRETLQVLEPSGLRVMGVSPIPKNWEVRGACPVHKSVTGCGASMTSIE